MEFLNYKVSLVELIQCSKAASCRKRNKLWYSFPCLLSKCLSIKKLASLQNHDLFELQFLADLWKLTNVAKKTKSHIQSENCYRKLSITVIMFSQSHRSVVSTFWVIREMWCSFKEHLNFLSCTKIRFIQKQDIYLKVVIFI